MDRDIISSLSEMVVRIPALLFALTFHEWGHARVALALGDDTAQREGRVSLNPLVHLDPIGTLAILFGPFGWAKPVPVNPNNFRHPRGDFLVSAAGPGMNVLLALISALLFRLLPFAVFQDPGATGRFFIQFLPMMVWLNLSLALFNLIPLRPLDGSHALANLLPVEKAYRFNQFNNAYGMSILFALIMLPMVIQVSPLGMVLGPPIRYLSRLFLGY
jgi:Zn-dependent protease